jgi:hypothetical protein
MNKREWDIAWPAGNAPHNRVSYDNDVRALQHEQIARAGVHLTELLVSIWPDHP